MKMNQIRVASLVVLAGFALTATLAATGCRSGQPSTQTHRQPDSEGTLEDSLSTIAVEGVPYTDVFQAAREVLGSYRFGINRVDAARGVLTTHPKRTVGIASPWDQEQSTIGQQLEDFANQQERVVRIEFDHNQSDADHQQAQGIVRVRVGVVLSRAHRPNWRIESESIRLSTHARSRDELGRIEPTEFREVLGHDSALATRIAQAIAARFE